MAQRAADRMGETLEVLIEDDDEAGPGPSPAGPPIRPPKSTE